MRNKFLFQTLRQPPDFRFWFLGPFNNFIAFVSFSYLTSFFTSQCLGLSEIYCSFTHDPLVFCKSCYSRSTGVLKLKQICYICILLERLEESRFIIKSRFTVANVDRVIILTRQTHNPRNLPEEFVTGPNPLALTDSHVCCTNKKLDQVQRDITHPGIGRKQVQQAVTSGTRALINL